jgi:anti-sigma regulatory factor (Ser/Thr protein kinase)
LVDSNRDMSHPKSSSPLEWLVAVPGPFRIEHVRLAFRQYFLLHATIDSDVWGAELIIAELSANLERHALGSGAFHLKWRDHNPTVTVVDDGPGFPESVRNPSSTVLDAYAEFGRGLQIVRALAIALDFGNLPGGGAFVRVTLPLERSRFSPSATAATSDPSG